MRGENSGKQVLEDFEAQSLGSRYEVLEEIGYGNRAAIFKARHKQSNRLVALKVLHAHLLENSRARASFANEALLLSSLTDERLSRTYDYDEPPSGRPFLTLELVEGQSLADYLSNQGPLAPAELIGLIDEILLVLEYLHQEKVTHNGLNCSKVFICSDSKSIKLLGFGRAYKEGLTPKSTQNHDDLHRLYESPEQFAGEITDQRSDIFSVSCLFYECLTGKIPLEAKTVSETLSRLSNESVPAPSKLRSDLKIAKDLDTFILKGMNREAKKRYQSASEMISSLRSQGSESGFIKSIKKLFG